DDFEHQLATFIQDALRDEGFEDAAMAREVPLSRISARWLAAFERRRRERGIEILVEQSGRLTFDGPAGPFTVTAKADRIELDAHGAAIIDYKTGSAPSAKQVVEGFAPQLPLTGAILAGGGFGNPSDPTQLVYVRVIGRGEGGKETDVSAPSKTNTLSAAQISAAEFDRLKEAVAAYDDPARAYVSWEAPQFMGNFGGNYDHLARVWEWMVVGGGDNEGEGDQA
ncbi:PD-(D/E)XK nuclease family protein, partial [Brevundimonas sp.]|uniref:PD-(D/E)XK nuclease family protein n=2 Tax=unclassified Brevundimonas TaxID=2622653 RepID=UPI0028994395